MLFNSLVFVWFFLALYVTYLALRRSVRAQNLLLLGASYFFYGWWDWRFLSLLLISTLVDFVVGARLHGTTDRSRRKRLVTLSIVTNLGILGFFKYFNFFAGSLADLLGSFGIAAEPLYLRIVLPVGISFYTFQSLSYTIDIYRRRMRPARSLADFALYVAFFPQLVAGPIERARTLLPQLENPRRLVPGQVQAGLYLILWGYFLKVVVADNLATVANTVFEGYGGFSGFDVALGAVAYGFQIYADFAGYSNIARGIAKLLGVELMVNFRLPYFATNPSDFWSRWHISLSTWLRDYLYIPLGGNRLGKWKTYRNLLLTMLLGGLWHGAAWSFVAWGAFHGLLLVGYRLRARKPTTAARLPRILLMFVLVQVGWVFFRSHSLTQALAMLGSVATLHVSPDTLGFAAQVAVCTFPLLAMEWIQHRTGDLLVATQLRAPLRIPVYGLILVGIIVFGVRDGLELIYFQF